MRYVQIPFISDKSDSSHNSLQMRQTSFSTSPAAALVTIRKILEYKRGNKNQALLKSGGGAWHVQNFDFGQKVKETRDSGCDGSTNFNYDVRHQYFVSNQLLADMAWRAGAQ